LPEAQLDRFFLKTALGYPSTDQELLIVDEQRHGHPLRRLQPVISVEDVHAMREAVMNVYVDPMLQRWIVELVRATRELDEVAVGASVRGSLALERAVRAWSLLDHRAFVVPEDIERLFTAVLLHRIVFRPTFLAEARRVGWAEAVAGVEAKCFTAAPRPAADPPAEQRAPERLPVGQPSD
jgi:MoxR-like ATPase